MSRPITVVTGGGRGIGAAICVRLAADGHDVVIGYRSDREAASAVAKEVGERGGRALLVAMDTAVEADVERLFDVAAGELGPITGLVNNAGVTGKLGALVDTSTEDLRQVLDVNVLGYLLCARRAAKDMAGRGGAIVNISSAAATLGSPGEYVHYAASKAATDAMTVGLAKELAKDGIRVNGVAPGTVHTRIHADMGDPDRPNRVASRIPLGRAGQPEEIAGAVSWLLSPDASFTTGTTIRIAGGL
ncbi:SDR family oxidoreductase [Allokutzneria multivorans]|uniref:SDR family oxidoreductase n=1 Tax=Allokutzneria multivorans TaxID=1142134 RepID=A0ABP7SAT2_9PSEU